LSVEESNPLLLCGDGGRFLEGLTRASLPSLGYALPAFTFDSRPIEHLQFLGLGATACVYGGSVNDLPSVAVKKYFRGSCETLAQEESALQSVVDVPGFIQLIGRASSDSPSITPRTPACGSAASASSLRSDALICVPLGQTKFSLRACLLQKPSPPAGRLFNCDVKAACLQADMTKARVYRPGAAEYCDLVDALANLHGQGFVHRDPRPDNFFRTADGQFFLADLGSASAIGAEAWDSRPWSFPYGPLEVLRAVSRAEDTAAPSVVSTSSGIVTTLAIHDFEQVARLVYATQSRVVDALPVHAAGNMKDSVAFWDSIALLEPLRSLLDAATAIGGACPAKALPAADSSELVAATASSVSCDPVAREAFKTLIRRVLL